MSTAAAIREMASSISTKDFAKQLEGLDDCSKVLVFTYSGALRDRQKLDMQLSADGNKASLAE